MDKLPFDEMVFIAVLVSAALIVLLMVIGPTLLVVPRY